MKFYLDDADTIVAQTSIRFSLCKYNTMAELNFVAEKLALVCGLTAAR